MNYKKLKANSYYIRIQKGTFNNNKHVEYSLTKDISNTRRTTVCLLNYKAVKDLINKYGFKKVNAPDTVWLNYPERMNLKNDEPLKITWH